MGRLLVRGPGAVQRRLPHPADRHARSRSLTRIVEYRKLGVDLILTGFLHYHEEIERFGRDVLPIVRELEVDNGLDPAAVPDPAAGLTQAGPVLTGAR